MSQLLIPLSLMSARHLLACSLPTIILKYYEGKSGGCQGDILKCLCQTFLGTLFIPVFLAL
ncbi:hypothetical protein GCM10011391_24400 [Pullulanibacillus camelliae]|uniref:Uncharacterized protein n=1 Tax=Pullulanibacillus camelliae TaxID=1707096 RepID=A0A8J2YI70_9BACL|nr:hypothetical protein GCM10011391_24400 [Pullulanibacillus camelliae]